MWNATKWLIFWNPITCILILRISISYTQACAPLCWHACNLRNQLCKHKRRVFAAIITELSDVHSGIEGWSSCLLLHWATKRYYWNCSPIKTLKDRYKFNKIHSNKTVTSFMKSFCCNYLIELHVEFHWVAIIWHCCFLSFIYQLLNAISNVLLYLISECNSIKSLCN